MGVPVFFKWLISKYPKIIINTIDDSNVVLNSFDVDNLYLDLNGIIHPCCHPTNLPQPDSFEEMLTNIYEYIDRLVKLTRPKKILYIAIDGVAPRAKMNQQRSRRFRAAFEAQKLKQRERKLIEEWSTKGVIIPERKKDFDSNIITPGTEFMSDISSGIKGFITSKLQNDLIWKNLNVIYNDANVSGEGEHKILEFIKSQRGYTNYNPNTSHCIFGADADLIMLALLTHEPNFYIMRQNINVNNWKVCEICEETGHLKDNCTRLFMSFSDKLNLKKIYNEDLCIISLLVLREYLEREFKTHSYHGLNKALDFERIIDDFIFICFFVGNDFLPSLPTLKIRDGALDTLVYLYKNILNQGYLTNNGEVLLERIEAFINKLAEFEVIFMNNKQDVKNNKKENWKNNVWKKFQDLKENSNDKDKKMLFNEIDNFFGSESNNVNNQDIHLNNNFNSSNVENKVNPERLFCALQNLEKLEIEKLDNELDYNVDKICYGKPGWRERYYKEKFKVDVTKDLEFIQIIKRAYIEGLLWVFKYYYKGCVSYEWYYPFHYSPFACDLEDIANLKFEFQMGKNFSPIEQLLSVLPPFSQYCLPLHIRKLMENETSEIIDFFPTQTHFDLNGNPFKWMGINLVPFIEPDRIRRAVKDIEHTFNEKEKERFKEGNILIYINSKENKLNQFFSDLNSTVFIEISNLVGIYKINEVEKDVYRLLYEKPFLVRHKSELLQGTNIRSTNVLISFSNNKQLIQEDSLSIYDNFYNIKTNQVSPEDISKLRSKRKIELDDDILKKGKLRLNKYKLEEYNNNDKI